MGLFEEAVREAGYTRKARIAHFIASAAYLSALVWKLRLIEVV